jgi:ATP-dependent Clp protease ATP-binding subunit ClpC
MRRASLGGQAIEPEHLILGLLRQDRRIAQKYFDGDDSIPESIRREVTEFSDQPEKEGPSVELPLSFAAKRALENAARESDQLEHPQIRTDHILFGILELERAVTADCLRKRGLSADRVRQELMCSKNSTRDGRDPQSPDGSHDPNDS